MKCKLKKCVLVLPVLLCKLQTFFKLEYVFEICDIYIYFFVNKNTLQAGYDDGFLAKVGGTAAQAEAYIKSALPHVQASYCHSSLGTKIHLQRLGDIKHYSGRSLQATGGKLQEMWDTTMADLNGADLMVYMGYEK